MRKWLQNQSFWALFLSDGITVTFKSANLCNFVQFAKHWRTFVWFLWVWSIHPPPSSHIVFVGKLIVQVWSATGQRLRLTHFGTQTQKALCFNIWSCRRLQIMLVALLIMMIVFGQRNENFRWNLLSLRMLWSWVVNSYRHWWLYA